MSQFKVGDWVVSSKRGEIFKIADMFTDGYSEYVTSIKLKPRTRWDSGIYYGQYSIKDVYLWTPSIGEWVWWVDSTFGDSIILREFHQEVYDYFKESTTIEPFIGTLPTWIK